MNRQRVVAWTAAAVASSFLFVTLPARTQQTQGPITPKAGTPVQQPPEGAIRVNVALVNTPVIVHDAKGNLVLDLNQKDFHVLDNGTPQAIESLDLGGAPLSAVLVFETSARIAPLLPAIQKSGIVFTQTVIGASGAGAVIGYNDRVDRLLPFSEDNDKIEKTTETLQPGTDGAKLYDAMSAAVDMLRHQPDNRRRVIIVVGEAVDRGSEDHLGEVLRDAQLSNIVIYTVGLSTTAAELRAADQNSAPPSATPPGIFGIPPIPGSVQTPNSEAARSGNMNVLAAAEWIVQHTKEAVKAPALEVATAATGGMYQSTFKDHTIEKAVDSIGGELNAQYTLSYHPTGSETYGYHTIKITLDKRGMTVRTRPGYYLEQHTN
jgi:VWFA-related protein